MDTYQFDKQGTLPKPRWIGRLVRLSMGLICFYGLYSVINNFQDFVYGPPEEAILWFFVLLSFHLLPVIVNIGFGKIWRNKPQIWVVALFFGSVYVGYLVEDSYWGLLSGYLLFLLPTYVFFHLGLSFLLAAVIATPGCEMRSIPHLWTIITGKETREHYCPGFLDGVDSWERSTGN